ncbi:MAG: ATP-binding protein [Lachnospiraceae bacterium]|nr:ATP-binding protein [Lachnospiraceae bacterium]
MKKNAETDQLSYITGLKPHENQYDAFYDLETEKIVNALYVKSPVYKGNKYIEALPRPWGPEDVSHNYTQSVYVPPYDELCELDDYMKEDTVNTLEDFRTVLPFHVFLENQFHTLLVGNYHKRRVVRDENFDIHLTVRGEDIITHSKMKPLNISDPTPGFALLGSGGCGKSTGINMLISHYPQTIIHDKGTWKETVQIVYLIVHCPQNSNFTLLYMQIGAAIDEALGNFEPVYQDLFSKGDTAKRFELLISLIQKFNIGCIMLDEIELMDLKSTKENSFQTFLALTNITGVAICVIGTMDAYKRFFSDSRTSRRVGVNLMANAYCYDIELFKNIMKNLSIFQWGKVRTDFCSGKMIQAMYEASHGVICDIIQIYKILQKERARSIPSPYDSEETKKRKAAAENRPITPEHIIETGKRYYEMVQHSRDMEEGFSSNSDFSKACEEMRRLNSASGNIAIAEAEHAYNEVMNSSNYKRYMELESTTIPKAIDISGVNNRRRVEKAFQSAVKGCIGDITDDEALVKTVAILQKKKVPKGTEPERKKVDLEQMQKELLQNNEEFA